MKEKRGGQRVTRGRKRQNCPPNPGEKQKGEGRAREKASPKKDRVEKAIDIIPNRLTIKINYWPPSSSHQEEANFWEGIINEKARGPGEGHTGDR